MRTDPRRPRTRLCPALLSIALAIPSLLAAPGAAHETGRRLSDDELVSRSAQIVRGKVIDLRSEWDPEGTHIYTYVDVRVDEAIKNAIYGELIKLRVLGGTVGDIRMTVYGMLSFTPDEEVILFLGENTRSFFPTVGQHEGKLRITTDETTGERRIIAPHRPTERLPNFRSRIDSLVATQAASQAPRRPAPSVKLP
jgi:hypothetical protein